MRAYPLHILLVEDHSDTSAVLTRLLRRAGHQVSHESTIAGALAIAGEENFGSPIQLLISDVGLPDGSGLDLMRALGDKPGIRGIALSGFGMDSDIERSQTAGFARHLTKPVSASTLLKVVEELSQPSPPPNSTH